MKRLERSGLLVFAVSSLTLATPLASYDLWWHLASGRWIWERMAVPRADPFSHTLAGAPWIDFEWLFQALAYLLHRAGGFQALVCMKASLGALAVRQVYRLSRTAEEGEGPALLAAACALALVRTRGFERPELASLALAPFFLGLVLKWRSTGAPAALWALPALTLFWANLHAGFALGLGLLALAAAGIYWEERAGGRPAARGARPLLLALAACAFAALLNPYGVGAYKVLFLHAREAGAAGAGAIEEWRSLRLGEYPVYWVLLLASFGFLFRDLRQGQGEARFWAPLVLGMGLFSSRQVRYPVYFALLASPYLFRRLGEARSAWTGRACAAAGAGLALWCAAPALRRDFRSPVPWPRLPERACAFLDRERPPGALYNDCALGGFVTWRLGGRLPVFCDGRYLFHGMQAAAASALRDPKNFQALLDARGVQTALLRHAGRSVSTDPEGRSLEVPRSPWTFLFPRERWALVHWDDAALVFVRRSPAASGLISRSETRVDPDDADFLAGEIAAGRLKREAVLADLQGQRERTGFTATGEWLMRSIDKDGSIRHN